METLNHAHVFIDGNEQFHDIAYDVEITQSVESPHHFSIVFPISSLEGYATALMDQSIDFIGKKISIYFESPLHPGKLEFVGMIDDISLNKTNAGTGFIRISGKSPDALLNERYDCRSFSQDTNLIDVIDSIFSNYESKILRVEYGGDLDENIPYTVQYNETDYNFLKRMCHRYGYLSYYNGQTFCVGLSNSKETLGTYGADISNINIRASLKEQAFSVNHYDWVNDTEYRASSAGTKLSGKHSYMNTVKKNSEQLYAAEGYYHLSHGQTEYGAQQAIDQLTNNMTHAKAANIMTISGNSYLADLRIGDILRVEGINFTNPDQKDAYGSFLITGLAHQFKSSGEYTNQFTGVPKETNYISLQSFFDRPMAENQRAKVVDNVDPEGLGRVRVNFPWQREGDEQTPWIKMATPYAGGDKGFYFIPEIGEEVLVGFENGDAEKPFVLSAGFNQSAKSGVDNADNNLKMIKTRSGHTILLDDTDGAESITITDKNSNKIYIDTANNNIQVDANETMTFNAKNININANENIVISAGKDLTNSVAKNYNIMAKNNNVIIEEKVVIDSKKQEYLSDEITMSSDKKNLTLISGKSVDIQSKEKVKLF